MKAPKGRPSPKIRQHHFEYTRDEPLLEYVVNIGEFADFGGFSDVVVEEAIDLNISAAALQLANNALKSLDKMTGADPIHGIGIMHPAVIEDLKNDPAFEDLLF